MALNVFSDSEKLLPKAQPDDGEPIHPALRSFFSLAVEERILAENPLRSWRFFVEDKRGRALSMAELKLILAGLRAIKAKPRGQVQEILYDVVALGMVTGMRLSEVIGLRGPTSAGAWP
jgi:integrase